MLAVSGLLVSCGSNSTSPNGAKCKDLPSSFPNVIPVYKPSCVYTIAPNKLTVVFKTKSSKGKVSNFYEDKLSGWSNYRHIDGYGKSGDVFKGNNGNIVVAVTVANSVTGKGAVFTIVHATP